MPLSPHFPEQETEAGSSGSFLYLINDRCSSQTQVHLTPNTELFFFFFFTSRCLYQIRVLV